MAAADKNKQGLMRAIRAVHSMVEKDDIEKQRQSQDNLGTIFGANRGKEVKFTEVDIQGIHGEWVRPNRKHMSKQVILYCHGGGYFTGSVKYARIITSKLAASTSMDVLCFDYGLAPEHPYPRALKDARKIWNYLMYQGYGSRDIVIAGDSAGGNLALVLTLSLMEEERILPKGLVLLSPWTDMTFSGATHREMAELDPVLSEEYLQFARASYAGEEPLDHPLVSPLYGHYEGFPPVYIQVGENELLLDDSRMLYQKLRESGVFTRLDVFEGMWHVFQMSPFKKAYEAMDQIADFIFELYR